MRWYWAGAVLALIGLAACGRSTQESPDATNKPAAGLPGDPALAASVAAPPYNLGDVDVSTIPMVSLSERSRSQSIEYEEMRTLRKDIAIANATVRAPYPSELWVTTTIDSPRGYRETDAVLVRIALTLDTQTEPILTKDYVWSGKTLVKHPETFEIDVMPFLKTVPESVLVKARVKIVWFPDTDPATITPETADESKGQTLDKLSNPLRINFN